MMYAYGAGRSRTHVSKTTRHAVDEVSHLCGAHDTLCGRPMARYLGSWEPGNPNNCLACTAILAQEPELTA